VEALGRPCFYGFPGVSPALKRRWRPRVGWQHPSPGGRFFFRFPRFPMAKGWTFPGWPGIVILVRENSAGRPGNMSEKRRIIGTTDEITTCSQCGREGLSHTVVIDFVDADGNAEGELDYFGSDCATKIFTGKKARQIETEARKADAARRAAEREARWVASEAERAVNDAPFYAWVTETYGFKCSSHGDIFDNSKMCGRKSPYALRAEFAAL
jgi:hypothetical protein